MQTAEKCPIYTLPTYTLPIKVVPTMYYHIKDRRWFDNRKQAKEHYGIACFRKLLHLKEIIFTNNQNSIANDELYSNPQINRKLSDGQQ